MTRDDTDYAALTVERAGGVVHVTFTRPDVHIQFDMMLINDMVGLLRGLRVPRHR